MKTYFDSKASKSWKVKGKPDFSIIGFPSALGAVTRSGQDFAPDYIRSFSEKPLPIFADTGESAEVGKVRDLGNLHPSTACLDEYLEDVAWAVNIVARRSKCVVALGGDDSISYGVADGLFQSHGELSLIHYDAHTDTYGTEESIDHGNWISFVRELGVTVTQRGCRTNVASLPYQDSIENRPVFLSIDMDVIDPAFAPGVSCPAPFGMMPHQLMSEIDEVCRSSQIVGIAINEVNVDRDVNGVTGLLAHTIIWKTMSKIHTQRLH